MIENTQIPTEEKGADKRKSLLNLSILFIPVIIYAIGETTRVLNNRFNLSHYPDLWRTDIQVLVATITIVFAMVIISALLYYFSVKKQKGWITVIFWVWLLISAIATIFYTSLADAMLFFWVWYRSNWLYYLARILIHLSHLLYIVVAVLLIIDTARISKNNKKEITNEKN